jgi:hypothetical protein
MSNDNISPVLNLALWIAIPLVVFIASLWRLRMGKENSRVNRRLWVVVCALSALPLLFVATLVLWFVAANFPFSSGIVAVASAPTGEEVCIVQTFKGAEPYQVSLFARKPEAPWVWHYLAHEDCRWRNGHVEFVGVELRIYDGLELMKTFSLAEATTPPEDARKSLPSTYTPEQILQYHNDRYRR